MTSARRLNFYGHFKRGKIAKKKREESGRRVNKYGGDYKGPGSQR